MSGTNASRLGWGILGTGYIAHTVADAIAASRTGRVVAVGSRSLANATELAEAHGARAHGSYEALLADPGVDVVYVAVPHALHARWAIAAAEAGKHVLCEKPLALNHAEAMAVVDAAQRHDVFLMEAVMYRCHPQTARLVELVRSGAIGEVRLIQSGFGFRDEPNPESRLFDPALGGGGILDMGTYPVSIARLLAGAAHGTGPIEPDEVAGAAHLGATGVDGWAVATLRFPGDILAELSTSVELDMDGTLRVFGSAGRIIVDEPFLPSTAGGSSVIRVHRDGADEPEEVRVDSATGLWTYEVDLVAAALGGRQAEDPAPTWADTLGNMQTLDRWRAAVGLAYPQELPGGPNPSVHGRPVHVMADSRVERVRIDGLAKPVSRLVMGCDNQRAIPHASVMFDAYVEAGGNAFDTAWIYGEDGNCERMVGQWLADRGIRDEVVLIGKGAHTPACTPADATAQLLESLDRLQTDHVDLYFLHRDDPSIPVGEFVDVLDEHRRAGRIGAYGGSNWTIERIEAANAWARANGRQGFTAVSNNLSLAMALEMWEGCVTSSDPASRAWFERTGTPLLAWSSQAQGFFAGRADPADRSDEEFVGFWYSDDNFERLARARRLAAERGVAPVNVALAWVLAQRFPTIALIGPRTLAELRVAFRGLDVLLTPDEVRWLNLEG